jgi:hypothetical protein
MVQKPIVNKVVEKGNLVGKTFVALMGLGNGDFPCLHLARLHPGRLVSPLPESVRTTAGE